MYVIDRAVKNDPVARWALPDRVFFACGACQVLAYVTVNRFAGRGFRAVWIRPSPGFRGNHFVATDGRLAFDYHGWTGLDGLLAHTARKARRWWPGWDCEVIDAPLEALVSEARSKAMGVHLREPGQFLHDALPRAEAFLDARPAPF